MPLSPAGRTAAADGVKAVATHMSTHSADPGATGANPTSAARQAVAWGSTSDGDFDLASAVPFTGGASNGACTHFGLWTAASGGTFLGGDALTGDQVFNAAGEYTVNEITFDLD